MIKKMCKIDDLTGRERLANNIMTGDYNVLLSEGTVLRQDYIEKLRELNIREVYVWDVKEAESVAILKNELEESFKSQVRDIFEYSEYKKHPVYAYSSLQGENWISNMSKNMILYHHERIDGTGYPLKATDIPLECRIIQVCDVFDEMICGIGCKRVKVYEAIEYLKNFKNIKFDGRIVDIFLEFTAVYPAGTYIQTNEGEIGIVLRQNKQFPGRPVIRVIQDKNGKTVDIIKDLLEVNNIYIKEVIG